ncbi:uncharacterized protein MICPUCDRAFT_57308 [Micromonas pusilla CCMP1545]|uniref:Predicted protein n=1 Tax=Micromonas pusilla (strain CCMP1545) TaxID=564608 RepID=C1MQI9_MICPC|nr:uncharacterized protein MICPUCDRAFT_57308 [Micromonas pusilla CCMP1545]EEH57719.1 predicted protein [Micromonas pusilla CCMP1545]|eukprot:XP_003057768.1 predicted protein [Micromonas pusilla CCMP1545]
MYLVDASRALNDESIASPNASPPPPLRTTRRSDTCYRYFARRVVVLRRAAPREGSLTAPASVAHARRDVLMTSIFRALAIATILLGCVGSVAAVGELKAVDYGEVVAAQHFNIDGIVTVKKMPGVKTSDVKVTLTINGAQKIATRIKPTGEFTLLDVPPGYHHLETFALGYTFPPLRLRITSDGGRECHFAEDVDEAVHVNPLVLSPVSVAEYFEPRGGLSVGALMKNPMFLMVAFTVVMAFYMPKMMESMDPEALKEMQEQMGNPPSLADMFGGGNAGASEKGTTGAERRAAAAAKS